MEINGYAIQPGTTNQPNGMLSQNGSSRRRMRPPTVDEALPFSPFSSIVPFNSGTNPFLPIHWRISQLAKQSASDIIPLPTIGLRSSVSLFSSATEREDARQGLESLNREVTDPHDTSQRLQQTLQDLQQLLQPDNVAQ
jgi:cohesin loading factor subunit SCC2